MDFNEQAMQNLVDEDRYLTFVFKDMSKRNLNLTNREVLMVIYNSNVIGDSLLSSLYEDELNKI